MTDSERTELLTEIDHLRDLLVFADGCVLAGNMRYGDFNFVLADLYAEDCEWAQTTLERAGCHARGKFLTPTTDLPQNDDPPSRVLGAPPMGAKGVGSDEVA